MKKIEQTTLDKVIDFNNTVISAESSLTASMVIFNIIFSGLVGLAISFIYHRFFNGVVFQKSFAFALILITMITSLVIMVISGNLILSLGMVGALSIVRFRSAIKDPLDVVYIFWSVASGIAIGVAQYLVAVTGFAAIALMVYLISKLNFEKDPKLVIVNCDLDQKSKVQEAISKLGKRVITRSSQLQNSKCELVFETLTDVQLESLASELGDVAKDVEVRVINYYGET